MRTEIISATSDFGTNGGCYVLVVKLSESISAVGPRQNRRDLPTGNYLYVGSAKGPGGLNARLRRHLRPEKKQHWHVDRLTTAGEVIMVAIFTNETECEIVTRIVDRINPSVPIPGFGSSDCQTCRAHMVAVPADFPNDHLLAEIGAAAIWESPNDGL